MTSSSRVPNMEGWKGASCEGEGVCVFAWLLVSRDLDKERDHLPISQTIMQWYSYLSHSSMQ